MKKTTPILYRKFSPNDYKREFEKIDKNIQNMDDIDFEITINTDIFFYIDFMEKHKKYANCKDSSVLHLKNLNKNLCMYKSQHIRII